MVDDDRRYTVVASWGGGWDHVSVSLPSRCPSWEAMACAKKLFFRPEECVVEYHPPEAQYVNTHPNCLHLWRPQFDVLPTPPALWAGLGKTSAQTREFAQWAVEDMERMCKEIKERYLL